MPSQSLGIFCPNLKRLMKTKEMDLTAQNENVSHLYETVFPE